MCSSDLPLGLYMDRLLLFSDNDAHDFIDFVLNIMTEEDLSTVDPVVLRTEWIDSYEL